MPPYANSFAYAPPTFEIYTDPIPPVMGDVHLLGKFLTYLTTVGGNPPILQAMIEDRLARQPNRNQDKRARDADLLFGPIAPPPGFDDDAYADTPIFQETSKYMMDLRIETDLLERVIEGLDALTPTRHRGLPEIPRAIGQQALLPKRTPGVRLQEEDTAAQNLHDELSLVGAGAAAAPAPKGASSSRLFRVGGSVA